MFKFSTTTCIIGLPFTSINGLGNEYPAFTNLLPAPAIGIKTFIFLSTHFGPVVTVPVLISCSLLKIFLILTSLGFLTLNT